jgi:hypothetical protein
MDRTSTEARVGRMIKNSEKWRTYFDDRTLGALERLAGKELADLGYSVGQAGDFDLTTKQRWFLQMRDGIARTRFFFREYGLLLGILRYPRYLAAARKQRSVGRY